MNYRNWRGCVLVAALSALSLTAGCSRGKSGNKATADAAAAAPKIEVPTKLHDFGTATEGDKLTHVFQIKNTGAGNLVLDRVTTSCGCTNAVIKTKEIPAGGTGEIEVTFDTTARRGPNRKSITVLSNDPNSPRTQMEVAVNVESLLAFDPFFVRLTPEYGEEQVREAWLVGKLVDQAKIAISEQSDDKEVTVERAEKTEGDKKLQGLRFKLKGKKVGYGSGRIVVTTGLEKPNQIVLRYSWNVKGNLRVLPAQLYFDDKRPGPKERTLRVSSSKNDFKLKDVQVQSGPFKAVLEKPDAGGTEAAYEVKVTMQEGAAPKSDPTGEVGKLVIISNDPLEPKKEVSLRIPNGRSMGPRPGMPGMMPPGPAGGPLQRGPGEPPPPPPAQP
ncbi:MAG: DUF1573 domain-containing protein [Polyangiaceae bacterium]